MISLISPLVQVCDGVSGARPGARRAMTDEYIKRIKELEEGLANALEVNESHQKLNGKLQVRLTEVEEDNKKLASQVEDKVNQLRNQGVL